jgi:hypothetical protein
MHCRAGEVSIAWGKGSTSIKPPRLLTPGRRSKPGIRIPGALGALIPGAYQPENDTGVDEEIDFIVDPGMP